MKDTLINAGVRVLYAAFNIAIIYFSIAVLIADFNERNLCLLIFQLMIWKIFDNVISNTNN